VGRAESSWGESGAVRPSHSELLRAALSMRGIPRGRRPHRRWLALVTALIIAVALALATTTAWAENVVPAQLGQPLPGCEPYMGPHSSHSLPAGSAAPLPTTHLTTRGNAIWDADHDAPFRLRSVNWYGAEEQNLVVDGLQEHSLSQIVAEIKAAGFNAVRLPFSNEMIELSLAPTPVHVCDAAVAADPTLAGHDLTPLQVFDATLREITRQGLLVILDDHTTDAKWSGAAGDENGLWFNGSFTTSTWEDDWLTVVRDFGSIPGVVGVDLRNEPRTDNTGTAPTWDNSQDPQNWRMAASDAGSRILSADPHLLVFVEGLDFAKDLSRAGADPVELADPLKQTSYESQLVYEAHDYDSYHGSVQNPESAGQMRDEFNHYWGYLLDEGHPVWIGEFGTCNNADSCFDPSEPSTGTGYIGFWWTQLLDYARQRPTLGVSYWPLNGTAARSSNRGATWGSAETFGVLNETWDDLATRTNGLTYTTALKHALDSLSPVNGDGWPMAQANAQHSGQSSARGPGSTPTVDWTFAPKAGTTPDQWDYPEQHSAPVVAADGNVYIARTGNDPQGCGESPEACGSAVDALRPDGTLSWEWKSKAEGITSSTPAVGPDGTVYVTSDLYPGNLIAIAPGGRTRWTLSGLDLRGSPTVAPDGTIYVTNGDGLYAIRPSDGAVLWHFASKTNRALAAAVTRDGSSIYFVSSGAVHSLSATGHEQWQLPLPSDASTTAPAVDTEGSIYVAVYRYDSANQQSLPPQLEAIRPDGTLKWVSTLPHFTNGPVDFGLPEIAVAATGLAVVPLGCNGITAVNTSDGTLAWSYKPQSDDGTTACISSPALGADDTVYVHSTQRAFAVKNGQLLWTAASGPSEALTAPAIGLNGALYIQIAGTTRDAGGGAFEWVTGGGVTSFSSPALGPPSNISGPAISGSPFVGRTLSCSAGSWSGDPTFSYSWMRDGSHMVSGPSPDARYDITSDDAAHSISCQVTARNGAGTASATSDVVHIRLPARYFALGDSYSSGEGVPPFQEGTDTDIDRCHRAEDAYPELLVRDDAGGPIPASVDFWACSGALTTNFSSEPEFGEPPQLSRMARRDATLVSFSIGGNDIGFAHIGATCLKVNATVFEQVNPDYREDCRDVLDASTMAEVNSLPLASAFSAIRATAPLADVYVMGYPRVLPEAPASDCKAQAYREDGRKATGSPFDDKATDGIVGIETRVAKDDVVWLNKVISRLNGKLAAAAADAGFHYVDNEGAFGPHDICGNSTDAADRPWAHGLVVDDRSNDPSLYSFHPNLFGQRAMEEDLHAAISAGTRLTVEQGQTRTVPVVIGADQAFVNFITRWPGSDLDTTLVSPSGQAFDASSPDIRHFKSATTENYVIPNPPAGTWQVRVHGTDVDQGGETARVDSSTTPSAAFAPVAVESLSRRSLIAPARMRFSAAASRTTTAPISSYRWDFGDGSTSTAVATTHVYRHAGTYTAKLTVTDAGGRVDTAKQTLKVYRTDKRPTARLRVDQDRRHGARLYYDAAGSADRDGRPVKLSVSFGDGTSTSRIAGVHRYRFNGAYRVSLVVSDPLRLRARRQVRIIVSHARRRAHRGPRAHRRR
jgi:endoglucanase